MENPGYQNTEGNEERQRRSLPKHEIHYEDSAKGKGKTWDTLWTMPTDNLQKTEQVENDKAPRMDLQRNVGLFGCVALIVGTMIGSGIFVSPGGVLENVESVWTTLIVWVACGILSTFGGITYIELSTVIPKSGGEYTYILETFGEIPGFITSWAAFTMIRPSQTSIICMAFAQYTIDPFVDDLNEVKWAVNLLTISAIALLTFLNGYSTKLASKIQIFFTVAKLGAVAVIIVAGIYNLSVGKTEYLATDFDKTTSNFGKIASAFFGGLWAYDGWNQLNLVSEEIKDPYKNLPRGILIGVPLVTLLYLFVNISFLTVISPTELVESSSVANLFGDKVLGVMSFLMPLSVAMSTFGAANGTLFTSARITYVAGRNGHLPDALCFVEAERKTPVISLLINSTISVALVLLLDIEGLIDFFSFGAWVFYGCTGVAMLVLRRTRPDAPRPFRAPLFMPIILVIMSAFLVVAPIVQDPQPGYFIATGFILFGAVVYFPFIHFKWIFPGTRKATLFLQKLFYAVPPDSKDMED